MRCASTTTSPPALQSHGRHTGCLLFASHQQQYIGDPIDCIVDEIPLNVMDTYCWIYSTFTIPNRLTGRVDKI
ncbi:unnamed protein product [Callosobruchus maculatus]|uniref:Innexin n=1 Tax=Callosobruchus maculatus TaxID=64391 RepID=A0A653BH61_CALMS|nr:unnamed protein product [Callosobruchus maculatus]